VKPVTHDNFGLLIAYLIPGFVTLWGLRPVSPTVAGWLAAAPGTAPTVGGLAYATLASTAAGLVVSAVRWAAVDALYHRTGIPPPAWDFRLLPANLAAFESHVRDHYRYYQGYANMLVAVVLAYGLEWAAGPPHPARSGWWDLAVFGVVVVLVLGSRDSLKKYYARTAALLTPATRRATRSIAGSARVKARQSARGGCLSTGDGGRTPSAVRQRRSDMPARPSRVRPQP
jgi:hypothetical protein